MPDAARECIAEIQAARAKKRVDPAPLPRVQALRGGDYFAAGRFQAPGMVSGAISIVAGRDALARISGYEYVTPVRETRSTGRKHLL